MRLLATLEVDNSFHVYDPAATTAKKAHLQSPLVSRVMMKRGGEKEDSENLLMSKVMTTTTVSIPMLMPVWMDFIFWSFL